MDSKKIMAPVLSAVKNFSPLLASTIAHVYPSLALALNATSAVLGYYGDYAKEKTEDLLREFIQNGEKIDPDILESDKFKSAFIKIIADNITEGNEEKRRLIKNYIVGFACGIGRSFNEHTKLISTLNDITLEEVAMLSLWREGGEMSKSKIVKAGMSMRIGDIEQIARGDATYQGIIQPNQDFGNLKRNQILLSLGYKGLLHVRSADNFGSGQEVKVKDATDFGKTFLKFILR